MEADSKVRWMVSDSNYQVISYTDSVYNTWPDTLHSVTLNFLNPQTIYNFNITSKNALGTTTTGNLMFATKATTPGTINVYFNKSVDTSVSFGVKAQGNVNFTEKLVQRIEGSGFNIDVATGYFENAQELTRALIKAKNEGVGIRFIYENKANSQWIDSLISAGIPVLKRNADNMQSGSMNHNFWIFDARCTCSGEDVYLFTSSAQMSDASLYGEKNFAVDIQDRTLAFIYAREFEEMWGAKGDFPNPLLSKFGSSKTDNIPHLVNLNGVMAEVYFTPSDSAEEKMSSLIGTASHSALFCTYDFTSVNLKNKFYQLVPSKHVRGIFDLSKAPSGVYSQMKGWADVWIDSSSGINRHSYLIVDPFQQNQKSAVLAGSYQWTQESNMSCDNDILILHSQVAAGIFYQEFHQRYRESSGHPVGIYSTGNSFPQEFRLYQNFPNPFNSQTVIRFDISKLSDIKLIVYNSLGKEVTVLANGKFRTGSYEVNFNASELPSGIYYYVLNAGNLRDSRKFVLIK